MSAIARQAEAYLRTGAVPEAARLLAPFAQRLGASWT
jgi:hypothetical protein